MQKRKVATGSQSFRRNVDQEVKKEKKGSQELARASAAAAPESSSDSTGDRPLIFADHENLHAALRRVATPPLERHDRQFLAEPLDDVDDIGVISKSHPRMSYADLLVRLPSIIIFLSLAIPVTMMLLIVTSQKVFETGTSDFRAMYHPAVLSSVAFDGALAEWSTRQQTKYISPAERTFPKYRLYIQFSPKDRSKLWRAGSLVANQYDIFQEESVKFIQEVEDNIFSTSVYLQLCWTNNLKFGVPQTYYPMCVPPTSISPLFYPGDLQQSPSGYVEFEMSGRGRILQIPRDSVVRTLLLNDRYKWFGDMGFTDRHRISSVMRTQVTLGYPLFRENTTELSQELYNVFVDNFVIDLFHRLAGMSHPRIQITFGGDRVLDAIIASVLDRQLMVTIATLVAAFVLMYAHIGSFTLAVCGVGQMALTYLASYYAFSQITSKKELTLITAISMIVTLCFDSHSIMWLYESFVQSGLISFRGRRGALLMEERMAHIFQTAIPSIAISHIVALVAFGSLILSPVPSVKYFSIMMLLNVGFDFFMIATFWPAVLVFYYRYFNHGQQTLLKQRRPSCVFIPKSAYFRDIAFANYLRSEEATKKLYDEVTTKELHASVFGGSLAKSRSKSMFDPLQRQHSLSASASLGLDEEVYKSDRMVPLSLIFQIIPQIALPVSGRPTAQGALAAYTRRMIVAQKPVPDKLFVSVVKGDRIRQVTPAAEIAKHREKWEYVGNFIGSVRPDDFSAYVSELTASSATGDNLIWDDPRNLKTEIWKSPSDVESFCSLNCLHSIVSKPRGGRYVDTREETDAFRLNYRVWHAGISKTQVFIQRRFLGAISFCRYPLVALGAVGAVTLIAMAFFFNHMTRDPLIVDPGSVISDYDVIKDNFPVQGSCDYCSGFETPVSRLPQPGLYALQECYRQGFGQQMDAVVDRCGKCMGNNSCLDCAARPWGISVSDQCGLCVSRDIANYCYQCGLSDNSPNGSCTACGLAGSPNRGGPTCSRACSLSTCPSAYGRCNTFTGTCDCHGNDWDGYYASDPSAATFCSLCLDGFTRNTSGACVVECVAGDACGCVQGRCTLCTTASYGPNCDKKNVSACLQGTLSGTNGTCTCPAQYDAVTCSLDADCSYHGIKYSAAEAVSAGCGCVGQFMGPQCQFCRCLNGGRCNPQRGHCECAPGWMGIDCSICTTSCETHGLCPRPLDVSQYEYDTCVAVFCSTSNISAGVPCTACNRFSHAACAPLNVSSCTSSLCAWNGTYCRGVFQKANSTAANKCVGCIGFYRGDSCEICDNPFGLECDYDGVLIGCDGKRTNVGQPPRYIDRCNVCAGTGQCLGCDGIMSSNAIPDRCGVCGGHDECLRNEVRTTTLDFVWGVVGNFDTSNGTYGTFSLDTTFNMTDTTFQVYLLQTCIMLIRRMPHLINGDYSHCVWLDFVRWVLEGKAAPYVTSNFTMPMTFPFVTNASNRWNLYTLMYTYGDLENRFSDMGFSFYSNASTELQWMRIHLSTRVPVDQSFNDMLEAYKKFEDLRNRIFFDSRNLGNILHVSKDWSIAVNQWAASRVVKYATGMGFVCFVVGTLILTLQPLLVLFSAIATGTTMASSLFTYFAMGWELGPVEQLGVSVAVAFSTQHAIALCVEYNSRLHVAAPALLSAVEIRKNALRGALASVSSPIITSLIIAFVAVLSVIFSIIRVFSRIGIILGVTSFFSLCFSIISLSACILVFGPTTSRELKFGRLLTFYASAFMILIALLSVVLSGEFPVLEDSFVDL